MSVGYRAILRLANSDNAAVVGDEELRNWLNTKLIGKKNGTLTSADWSGEGLHQLGAAATLQITRLEHDGDGSRRQIARFTETNAAGEWEVTVISLSLPFAREFQQTLVVEAALSSAAEGEALRNVSPPRIVALILERLSVRDGDNPLTAEPSFIRDNDVDELVAAILDETRITSVIVAPSPGADLDVAWKQIVKSLTSQSLGVAATFVPTGLATAAINARLPESHRVAPGQVRTFLPRVDIQSADDALRHRFVGPATLARSIDRKRVFGSLPYIHAAGARRRLLETELPGDVRRSLELLSKEEARVQRNREVERQVLEATQPEKPELLVEVLELPKPADSTVHSLTSLEPHIEVKLRRLLYKWAGSDKPSVEAIDGLERILIQGQAESNVALKQVNDLLATRSELELTIKQMTSRLEDVELDAAIEAGNAIASTREATILRQRLIAAERFEDTFVEPEDDQWAAPESIQELISRLSPGKNEHLVSSRVQFTGDEATALEVQKRDQVGRYATAFWEYVRVLFSYSEAKASGTFSGSVHMYLTDDSVLGHKYSPQRHAPTESETVINAWGDERVFSVPAEVSGSGQVQMLAHFRPTNENSFAPRLYYFDDVADSGKIYVGYIGRHLTNTKTSGS